MHVGVYVLFLQTIFSKILNVCWPPKKSAEYLFQKKWPRLWNTHSNDWFRFRSLPRKPNAENLSHTLSCNTWLNQVFFQSSTVLFRTNFCFSYPLFGFMCVTAKYLQHGKYQCKFVTVLFSKIKHCA